jgi:hypothetical protein
MRVLPLTRRSGLALATLSIALIGGCGQKGPLVKPTTRAPAPVVIRAPGGTAGAPASAAAPAGPAAAPAAPAATQPKQPDDDPHAPARP